MRVLVGLLLVGIAECGGGSSPPGGGAVSTPEGSQAKKSVERRETLTIAVPSVVTSVTISPDGKRIVSGSYDRTVKVWDAQTGQETLTLKGHSNAVTSLNFSPDGKRIVSGSLDKTVKVWDAQTGEETLTLKGHTHSVQSVAFSPDEKRIVSGHSSPARDKTLKVWDISSLDASK